ncbi:MAG: chemotaxis protein CheX [Nitrospinae bacterium]|nr:chemotaxis protein CheX [Nitrospinota bacterium]
MQFIEREIRYYTENIWDSILGLKATPTDAPYETTGKDNSLAGCVHIMGVWEGTVALQCPTSLARKAASIMFNTKVDETGLEQILDALGELTNMTGGNIKSNLPEPSYLSLPAVAVTNYTLRIPGTELVTKVTFECDGEYFAVALLKRTIKGNPNPTPVKPQSP